MTKNLERKKKEQIKGRTNRRRPIFNPTIQLVVVNLYTIIKFPPLTVVEISLTKNLERKKKEQTKEEQIGECPFAIPRYKLSLWTCIPNIKFLSLTVVEIFLTKNFEKKEKGTNTRKNKEENAHL